MNCEECKGKADHFCFGTKCKKFVCTSCKSGHEGHFCFSLKKVQKNIDDFKNGRDFLRNEMGQGMRKVDSEANELRKESEKFKKEIERRVKKDCDEIIQIVENLRAKDRQYEDIKKESEDKSDAESFKELLEQNEEKNTDGKTLKDCVSEKDAANVEKFLQKILCRAEPTTDSVTKIRNGFKSIKVRSDYCKKFYRRFDDMMEKYLASVESEVNLNEAKSKLEEYKEEKLVLESKCITIKSHISNLEELSKTYMKALLREVEEYLKMQKRVTKSVALIGHESKDKILKSIAALTNEIIKLPSRFEEYDPSIKLSSKDSHELISPFRILPFINKEEDAKSDLVKPLDDVEPVLSTVMKQGNEKYDDWKINENKMGWVPAVSTCEPPQYIEFLLKDRYVDWVALEMRGIPTCWVTRIRVEYYYGKEFVPLESIEGQYDDEYEGNIDGTTVERINFRVIIRSKGIRIYPIAWRYQIAMKVRLFYRELDY